MAIVRAAIKENDGYGIENYTAPQSDVLGAVWDDTMAKNPTAALTNIFEQAIGNAQVERGPQAYVISADEANSQYGELGLKFDKPVSAGYARTLADKKRAENKAMSTIERGEGGFVSSMEQFGVGLAASAVDPIAIGSMFIPVVGEERMAAMTARVGLRTARVAKGTAEGLVGTAVLEPLVYGGAQAAQYNYDLGDSLMNLAFGTVLGGGLHFAGGEIHDAWRGHKVKALAETGKAPPAATLAEAIDNLTPPERANALRMAVGQMVSGQEVNVEPMLASKESIAALNPSTSEKAQARRAEIETQLAAPDIGPEQRAALSEELRALGTDAAPVPMSRDMQLAISNHGSVERAAQVYRENAAAKRADGNEKSAKAWETKAAKIEKEAAAAPALPTANPAPRPKPGRGMPEPTRAKPELEVPDNENTILRAAELPEDVETSLAELDDMLNVEWKAGTLTEAEMNAIDAADLGMKDAESAARGLFAAATCIFRKA